MNNLEFTTCFGNPRVCDNCNSQIHNGFWHLHDGTPVLFFCYTCTQKIAHPIDVQNALNSHKEACFARMENET